ncbi:MAG: hypothetical protein ACE5JS_09400 [Nitrospinota bacterium]
MEDLKPFTDEKNSNLRMSQFGRSYNTNLEYLLRALGATARSWPG